MLREKFEMYVLAMLYKVAYDKDGLTKEDMYNVATAIEKPIKAGKIKSEATSKDLMRVLYDELAKVKEPTKQDLYEAAVAIADLCDWTEGEAKPTKRTK